MPGHKGRPVLPELNFPFPIDYTEIEGTGNLYEGDEPILSAERDAARYYGARDCLFLTGGSTQALMTAIGAAVPEGGTLILDRNCHKSVTHAMALLDLTPVFVVPEPLDGMPGLLDAQDVEPREAEPAGVRRFGHKPQLLWHFTKYPAVGGHLSCARRAAARRCGAWRPLPRRLVCHRPSSRARIWRR